MVTGFEEKRYPTLRAASLRGELRVCGKLIVRRDLLFLGSRNVRVLL